MFLLALNQTETILQIISNDETFLIVNIFNCLLQSYLKNAPNERLFIELFFSLKLGSNYIFYGFSRQVCIMLGLPQSLLLNLFRIDSKYPAMKQ